MELDDQLAALAAGELDDDTARALRARAAADAALARRLARHERLQELLTTWAAPPLGEDAAARIDATIDEALAALDDSPLAARAEPTGPLRAADTPDEPAAATRDGVVDMQAARERRQQRRGLPAWVPGATVAAALLAVVGTGVVAGLGGGLGGFDEATDDTLADSVTTQSAQDEAADSGLAESEAARDDAAEESMDEEEALAPAEPDDIQLAEGELLALLDRIEQSEAAATQGDGDDTAEATDDDEADGGGAGEPDACVVEALERDTAAADGREVTFLARGTYADQPAQFVVISTPVDGGERIDVLAYDPADCSLLARDEVRTSAGG